MNKTISLFFLLVFSSIGFSQVNRPNLKFGNINADDLSKKIYSIDSNAEAVTLYKKCDVKYEGSNSGWFNVIYKYQEKIHILHKNAFDLGTITIPLRKFGTEEDKIEKLEAVTYNLENGTIKKTKIDKGSIFKDKVEKNITLMKFTFPELKEGSIIEFAYTISTPVTDYIREWDFQEEHPVLWSEYKTEIPSIFNFQSIRQGYNPFVTDSVGISKDTYYILIPGETASESSSVVNVPLNTLISKWALQNIPALKLESFTTTLDNHISKISFQLLSKKYPNGTEKKVSASWMQVAEDLMKDEEFGLGLNDKNRWLDDDVKKIVGTETDGLTKAKKIFEYVRNNFTCTNHNRYFIKEPLKKIFQQRKGTVAEINLLLIAMYRNAGFSANPVILSTRKNGWTSSYFPLIDRYNYAICSLELGEERILLDASYSKLGFGKLPNDCYNGYAKIIGQNVATINLSADSVKESSLTSVQIINNSDGKMLATVNASLGQFESISQRESIEKEEDFFNAIKKKYAFEIEMKDKAIENLKEYEEPLKYNYTFGFKPEEDLIYFTPLLVEAQKNNPFKAEERHYPVEMPHTVADTYILNIETPNGYEIDEMPKSTRVKLNETEGMFEYLIAKSENGIQLRSTIRINKANFTNEDYQTLRDFFGYIVKKHAEQIVYKKKK